MSEPSTSEVERTLDRFDLERLGVLPKRLDTVIELRERVVHLLREVGQAQEETREATAEVDKAAAEADKLESDLDEATTRLEDLRRYARHEENCAGKSVGDCSCGLAELLREKD